MRNVITSENSLGPLEKMKLLIKDLLKTLAGVHMFQVPICHER